MAQYSFFNEPPPKRARVDFDLPLSGGRSVPMALRELAEHEGYVVRDRAEALIERYVPIELRGLSEEQAEAAREPLTFPPVGGQLVTVTSTLCYQVATYERMQAAGPEDPNYWSAEEFIAMCVSADPHLEPTLVAWFTLADKMEELEGLASGPKSKAEGRASRRRAARKARSATPTSSDSSSSASPPSTIASPDVPGAT